MVWKLSRLKNYLVEIKILSLEFLGKKILWSEKYFRSEETFWFETNLLLEKILGLNPDLIPENVGCKILVITFLLESQYWFKRPGCNRLLLRHCSILQIMQQIFADVYCIILVLVEVPKCYEVTQLLTYTATRVMVIVIYNLIGRVTQAR